RCVSRTRRRAAEYTTGKCRSTSSRNAPCERAFTNSSSNSRSSIAVFSRLLKNSERCRGEEFCFCSRSDEGAYPQGSVTEERQRTEAKERPPVGFCQKEPGGGVARESQPPGGDAPSSRGSTELAEVLAGGLFLTKRQHS